MKDKKLLSAMNDVDEKYIDEANPKRKPKIMKRSIIAACILSAMLMLNLWLFLPIQTNMFAISQYSDSEYFPLIQKMYAYQNKPTYKNNFSAIKNSLFGLDLKNGTEMPPSYIEDEQLSGSAETKGEYVEVTDNQVSGVIEWDIIKRSDKYIYRLQENAFTIYEIDGTDTHVVSQIKLSDIAESIDKYRVNDTPMMYLSKDCKTVTIIFSTWSKRNNVHNQTAVVSLNVGNPMEITVKGQATFSGLYRDSRIIDGRLILFTENYFYPSVSDFRDESSFVPQIDTGDGFKSIPFEKIVIPDNSMKNSCTAIYDISEETLEINDMLGIYTSVGRGIYVSHDGIILPAFYRTESENMTELFALSLEDGFEYRGYATVKGSVKDQYSLDIKNGFLRVVTTTTSFVSEQSIGSISSSRVGVTSASLYCILLENMKTIASVENFAPEGEAVRSVRFEDDKAYVCTSFMDVMLDPVFIFDISNTGNITSKDTGVIPGFSDSLINFGDFLLGIGYNELSDTKIEVYTEGENSVDSVCKYEPEGTDPYLEYKSFLIDRENQLFGFAYMDYYHGKCNYVLLGFDGASFTELKNVEIGSTGNIRAFIIDDCLYVFEYSDDPIIVNLK